MHDERRVAGERFVAVALRAGLVIGRLAAREVGDVVSGPFFPVRVPPHQRLPLAPRRAVGTRGRAVIEDAPVERPGVAPAMSVSSLGRALVGLVLPVEDAGVNPAAAG